MMLLIGGVIAVASAVALMIKGVVQHQIIPTAENELNAATESFN